MTIGLNLLNIHDPYILLTGIESNQCLFTFLVKQEACLGNLDGQKSYLKYLWLLKRIKLLSLIKIKVVKEK